MGLEKEKLIYFLNKQIKEIDDLKSLKRFSPNFHKWQTTTLRVLLRAFGSESSQVQDFKDIRYSLGSFIVGNPDYKFEEAYKKGLDNAREVLKGIVEEIETFGMPEEKNTKKSDPKQVFNITQNQSLDLNIKLVLESNLTVSQFKELETILKEKDEQNKVKSMTEFLEKLGIKPLIDIIKSLLI